MKNILLHRTFALFFFLYLSPQLNSQCSLSGAINLGSTAPTTSCHINTATTCAFFDEYSTFANVVAGNTYKFSVSWSGGTAPYSFNLYDSQSAGSVPVAFIDGASSPLNITYTIPGGANDSIFVKNFNSSGGSCSTEGDICNTFTIECTSCPAPTHLITTFQPTGTVNPGATSVQVLRIDLDSLCSTDILTNLQLTTGLTTNLAEITNVKVYYTTAPVFSNSIQFGSTLVSPTMSFGITGSQPMTNGANYLWVVYDVPCTVVNENLLDASISQVSLNSGNLIPSIQNPVGSRTVLAPAVTTTQPSIALAQQGSFNVQILRIDLTNIPTGTCTSTLTAVNLDLSSMLPGGLTDITTVKAYHTNSTTFATTTQFGTNTSPASSMSISGSLLLPAGTSYLWIVFNLSCTAVIGHVLDAALTSTVLTTGTISPTTGNPTGTRTISALLPPVLLMHPTTASVPAGSVNAQILRVTLPVGVVTCGSLTSLSFNTNGTTNPTVDILKARVFYTGTSLTFSTATQFGSDVNNPSGSFSVTGSTTFMTAGTYYFWLVYDLPCNAPIADVIDAEYTGAVIGSNTYPSVVSPPTGNRSVTALQSYDTKQDGPWENINTWVCGVVPPSNACSTAVVININHNVTVSSSGNMLSDLSILAGKTLTVASGAVLTLGCSSTAAATGFSNKTLTANGILDITGGVLNVNGGIVIGSLTGGFHMSGGVLNIDPNDGTQSGSYAGNNGVFYINQSDVIVIGGNINFIDPPYQSAVNSAARSLNYVTTMTSADASFGTGNIITLGGGDDQNPSNTNGFYLECQGGTGTLALGTIIVDGTCGHNPGTSLYRHLQTHPIDGNIRITKVKNLTLQSGAHMVQTTTGAMLAITGNLVNNGVMTIQQTTVDNGLVFAGDAQFSGTFTLSGSTVAQSLSGTGYFRKSISDPIPTLQSGNMVNSFTVYHQSASPGLTLNMPLLVNNTLRLADGKINTTASNTLTLGAPGTAIIPGTTAIGCNCVGTLYAESASETPMTTQSWDGGWVNGLMRRYFLAATNPGNNQTGILPVGSNAEAHPFQVLFTTAPATAGYIDIAFNSNDPGEDGLPAFDSGAGVIIEHVSPSGWWDLAPSENFPEIELGSGIYSIRANAINFMTRGNLPITQIAELRLIKRPNSGDWLQADGSALAPSFIDNIVRSLLPSFGEFGIGGPSEALLPIELKFIKAKSLFKSNLVEWATESEFNTQWFVVERAASTNTAWVEIGKLKAALNSTVIQFYQFEDLQPYDKSFYRLKTVDLDGGISYSNIVSVQRHADNFGINAVSPVPFIDFINVSFEAPKDEDLSIVVTDILGKNMLTFPIHNASTNGSEKLDLSSLIPGTYFITLKGTQQNSALIMINKY